MTDQSPSREARAFRFGCLVFGGLLSVFFARGLVVGPDPSGPGFGFL